VAIEQTLDFFSGNDVLLNYTVTNQDGTAKDLTAASAVVFIIGVKAGKPALVTKTLGAGIAITTPLQGKFTVTLVPADTEAIKGGGYYHEARVTDAAGKKVTVTYGTLNLRENTIAS